MRNAAKLCMLVGTLAFAGYVADRVVGVPYAWMIGVFFAGAILAHDFVLFPLYSSADRAIRPRAVRPTKRPSPPQPARESGQVTWINHVRVPALLSGLLLLIFFPLVFSLGARTYRSATGLDPSPYLGRWLLVSAALFAASGLIYLWRLWRTGR